MFFDEKEYILKALDKEELEDLIEEIRGLADRKDETRLVIRRKKSKSLSLELIADQPRVKRTVRMKKAFSRKSISRGSLVHELAQA